MDGVLLTVIENFICKKYVSLLRADFDHCQHDDDDDDTDDDDDDNDHHHH